MQNVELRTERIKPYEILYSGMIRQQTEVFTIIEEILKTREDILCKDLIENLTPCDACDLLYSVMD